MSSQVIKLSEISDIKNCTLAYGHFDSIHPGHIRYLKYAKSLNNKLVVAIMNDTYPQHPKLQFNQKERAEALGMLDIADYILCLEDENLSQVITKFKPKVLILGREKENPNNSDIEIRKAINLQKKLGGSVKFRAGEVNYSSADLLSSPENEIEKKRKRDFLIACKKQQINSQTLLRAIDQWQNTKLIVVGDVIVDQYLACEALGLSAEAPVIVVKETEQKSFLGGAGIVASHIKSLGGDCDLSAVVGNDELKFFVKNIINSSGIGNFVIEDSTRPTTLKKRYLVDNQKIFRVSRLEENFISKEIEEKIINNIECSAKNSNGIIISDFVYGVITDSLIKKIQKIAKKYNLILIADLQCSSQIGSISKFKDFSLLCPNEKEARISLQDNINSIEFLSQKLLKETRSKGLIMKLGASGFIAYENNSNIELKRQSFPALTVKPLDVSGAGDSLLSVMALGLASGQSIMVSAALAACISGLSVKNMGNIPITTDYLIDFILKIFNDNNIVTY